jgi:hypothetical protein
VAKEVVCDSQEGWATEGFGMAHFFDEAASDERRDDSVTLDTA